MNHSSPVWPIRFGVFEINPRTGELRKQGLKIKLGQQPFKLLLLLLERSSKNSVPTPSPNPRSWLMGFVINCGRSWLLT